MLYDPKLASIKSTTMLKDSPASIFRSSARFFSGTLFSRLTGYFRDLVMAYAFGTSANVADFFVAFRFAHLGRRIFGESSLQTAFAPHFEEMRKANPAQAASFFRDLHALLTIILMGVITLLIGGLALLPSFFSLSQSTQEILFLTILMLPSLLFICLFGLNSALLECEKSFFTPGIAPAFFNIVWTIGACIACTLPLQNGIYLLSLFIIFGCAAQWGFTLPKTIGILKHLGNTSLWRQAAPFSKAVKRLFKPLLLANLGIIAAQVNNGLDPLFARFVDSEGPAWLWYGIRLQQLPLALFGIALSTALIPPLARAKAVNDELAFKKFLQFSLMKTCMVMIPISFAICYFGQIAVSVLFGRGDFGQESIIGTTYSLLGYALGLVPMTFILILAPAFYACGNYKTPSKASVYSIVINIALNSFFVFALNGGACSVAIATSLSAWANFLFLFYALQKQIGVVVTKEMGKDLLKVVIASMTSIAIVWFFPFKFPYQILTLAVEGCLFLGSYCAISYLFNQQLLIKNVQITEAD